MDFWVTSVFVDRSRNPLRSGNPLAVFVDGSELSRSQMQAVAQTLNLSETTFVTALRPDGYDMRIFTPRTELPFAGHPTIGTAWVLRHLGRISVGDIEQRSGVGITPVRVDGDLLWLRRRGHAEDDRAQRDPSTDARVARALGLQQGEIGLEAREIGRPGRLVPAVADAGMPTLVVPLRDIAALESCSPSPDVLADIESEGAYCFTALGAGRVRARGFFPGVGVVEDPATGAAAAALGIYLEARLGPIELQIQQGVEMDRPCRIEVKARAGDVEVGGSCALVSAGRLERLP